MKKSLFLRKRGIVPLLVFLLFTATMNAANFYSIASGNWNATTTWSPSSGGSAGISSPGPGDTVFIEGSNTVTLTADASCAAITYSTVSRGTLDLAGFTLNVSGNVTMARSTVSGPNLLRVDAGTLNVANIAYTNAAIGTFAHRIEITTGTVTVSGNVTEDSGSSNSPRINITGAGTLRLGGSFFTTAGILNITDNASTVEYNGTGQTVGDFAYGNLILSGSGTKNVSNGAATTLTASLLTVNTGVVVNSIYSNVSVESLKLGGWGKNSGTWGGTGSGATNINTTFFTGTGTINVTTDTRILPVVTPTIGTYIFSGLAQGPDVATNTGTSTSYTWSYEGVSGTTYGPSATKPTLAGTYEATVEVAEDEFYQEATVVAPFTIAQKTLTITGLAVTTKVYDATTTAVLTGGTLVGVNPLANAVSFILAGGIFDNKNIGSGKDVTANTITLIGADAANYVLTAPTGLTGTITARGLTITGSSVTPKTYDGNTTATITGQTLVGIQGADVVSLTVSGTFDNKNAGTGKVVTSTSVLAGADKDNYTLTQPTGLTGDINKIALTVTGQSVTTKSYDGTVAAAITGGTLVGVILSEDVTLVPSGTFDTPNIGTGKMVTDTSTLGGTAAGNYTLIATVGLTGTITAKALTITGLTVTTKVYDGNTTAVLTGGTFVGLVSPDVVTFTLAGGTFDNKNIGTGKAVTAATVVLGGANAGDYTLTQPTGLTGTIDPLALTIVGAAPSKVYDGTTTAELTGGLLTGVLLGENVVFGGAYGPTNGSGTYDNKNVGTGKTVTSNSIITGADAGNYTLTQPTIVNGVITVAPLAITADNQSKCFGTVKNLGTTAFTSTGLLGTDTIGGVTLTSIYANDIVIVAGSNAPIVASAATGGTFAASNYMITYNPGTLYVTGGSTVGIASSTPTLCQNTALSPITHTALVSTGIGTATGLPAGVTATWTLSGTVDGTITISGTPTVSGTFNYSIPVLGTCGGTSLVATGTITVNPTLVASVSIAVSAPTVCNTTSVTFTATPTEGGISPTYQWYNGLSPIGGETNATFTYVPTIGNTDAINVVMTSSASPCLTASPATSNSITVVVNPILTANVAIAASPAGVVCEGTSVTYTATPTNGGTTPTYQWYNGVAAISGETGATYSYVPTVGNTDAINVVMTSNATPCLVGSPVTSSSITTTVTPAVVTPTVTYSSGVLVSSSATGNQWWNCDTNTAIVGATAQTYTVPLGGAGSYKVVVTSGSCSAMSDCVSAWPLAVNGFDSKEFSYYPNPVNNVLNLSYSKELSSVKVINILGQVMSSSSSNDTTAKVDMSNFPAGLYLVEVKSGDESKTIKVMKN